MTDRMTLPCEHLYLALSAIREAAAVGAPMTAELTAEQSGNLWLYVVRLQDAVLAAETPWVVDPAAGVHDDPRTLIEDAASEVRGLEYAWQK